eukprot:3440062-Ditylum_brightwellii.AAC.1
METWIFDPQANDTKTYVEMSNNKTAHHSYAEYTITKLQESQETTTLQATTHYKNNHSPTIPIHTYTSSHL